MQRLISLWLCLTCNVSYSIVTKVPILLIVWSLNKVLIAEHSTFYTYTIDITV